MNFALHFLGMPHLLHKIVLARAALHHNSKLIIVSDANTFFIETFLSGLKPSVTPDAMLTNLAEKTEDGNLKLTPYENQTACNLCPRNLCKGNALLKYISKKGPFERVFYTGDGGNDICPATKLTENDVVFVRKNFAMDKILKHGTWKGQNVIIKAKVVLWENAKEIEREIQF
jgi:pyridoxal phosphate phosphatase PHOSPHO2